MGGDKEIDVLAVRWAGCKSILVGEEPLQVEYCWILKLRIFMKQ